METIYYSLDAKRLTVCGEAAGRTLALTVDLAATGAVVVLLAAVVLRFFAG